MLRSRFAVVLGLGLVLVGLGHARADAAQIVAVRAQVDDALREQADAWAGSYRFVGGQAQIDARDAAIEEIVEQLNVLIRGIARDKLKQSNPVPKALKISREGDELTVEHDQRSHTAKLDGSVVKTKDLFGDPIDYHVALDEQRLRQFIVGAGGKRVTTYRKKGSRITMRVRITAPRLPQPLEYSLTYAAR